MRRFTTKTISHRHLNATRSFCSSPASSVALMFPGQGAQYVGMGADLIKEFPYTKKIFETANEILKEDLQSIMFSGPAEVLQQTKYTQPALLVHSIALMHILQNELGVTVPGSYGPNGTISHALGHSLGEITALCAVGSLTLEDAIALVHQRGKAMQEAVQNQETSMYALLFRHSTNTFEQILEKLQSVLSHSEGGVCQIANINSPLQIVLSGHTKAIESAIERAKVEFGGHKLIAKKLNVSAPFHCTLMEPAAQTVGKVLSTMQVAKPLVPIVNNITATEVSDPSEIRNLLQKQVTGTVKWLQSVEYCKSVNVKTFLEIGAGKVLSGLMKQIDPSLTCISLSNAQDIKESYLYHYVNK